MKLSMRQVKYISEVARLGSILAAAEALNVSQSSIIAAINLAEGDMDARLFERRPSRGVTTTPAGDRFVSAAQGLLAAEAEFAKSISSLSGKNAAEIKIGCFEPFGSLFMPDLIRAYTNRVGTVDVALFEGDQTQLHRWLVSKTVDFVVAYDIGPSFNGNITPICRVPPHVMIACGDELEARDALSLSDIAERPLVLLDLPHTVTYLLALFDTVAICPRVGFRTRSYPTMSRAVAAGFGVSVLNMRPLLATEEDAGGVVRRPLIDDLPQPTLVVADAYGAQKPEYARFFIQVVREFFDAHGLPSAYETAYETPARAGIEPSQIMK
ncbi:LysR family transcriptional regulator [Phyllobacterium leguminum]|uniref:DNA-binding transcriptional LysR family regulator n=1 Tax=Phyllobacterium leguminum TaxID=314237 RepID=A0A318SYF2_9HYPH|nr:LysR family transcriptional regulator [Phyllobacterium leguminum]PYE86970.1 DNA-binding transcriptional LysR family regulator [Phyllobacterium leguminum]